MQDILNESLRRLKRHRVRRMRMLAVLLLLSLIVSLDVFWVLRQPGLTLAGDADCGITEHTHDARCQSSETPCPLPEHIHTIACYSDKSDGTETQLDWQKMFADYPYTQDLGQDLAGIAKTQVGYAESKWNFQVDENGSRNGYTRYGAWYGAPYNDWSAMFVSFCLHYAGADPVEYPGNIGAASMLAQWKRLDRYVPNGTYEPELGDLVFFTNNTVGIVAQVQGFTVYVIRGDMDGMVRGDILLPSDASIAGYGVIRQQKIPPGDEDDDNADLSMRPTFSITEGAQAQEEAPVQAYSFRMARSVTQLLPYLNANNGSYFFTLYDYDNVELPKDAQGNYIAVANEGYKLTISFNSPEGFIPGTYEYQVPNGLMVDGGEGSFILQDGTNVGTWVVTDTGLITLTFNDHMKNRTDITISSTLGIHFPEREDPIDFDGKITVVVEKPPQQAYPTYVNKWGHQGGTEGSSGNDPGKIFWGIEIIGNKDSQIVGNILTDRIILGEWSKTHRFTASDIAGGLSFGVSGNGGWHTWHVSADDPHLIWTETGWSYKMPATAICDTCGEIELGNEGWIYYISYSSTPDYAGSAGTFGYENDATIDGAYGYSWVNFAHGEVTGSVNKHGSFVSDAGGGAFLWEFQANIPGRANGQRAIYHWYFMDYMTLINDAGAFEGYIENTANLATVLVTYNGQTFQIPRVQDATDADMFAWDNAWTITDHGINHAREINILCRCQCTPETCHWGTGCDEYWFIRDDGTAAQNGFCQCWTPTEDMTFTFLYKTTDLSSVHSYGGLGYRIQNEVKLFYKPDGTVDGALVSSSRDSVLIPGILTKELTHDFDGYTAHYKVTVNESKLVLTNGTPLTIHDVMTDTLAYISGSLVITAEDGAGNLTTLRLGTDYTVAYDGTGNQTDAMGKETHVLDIVILHPQPVKYILEYDATLILPKVVTGSIKYSNSATISLWGQAFKDNVVEKVYADINIAAKTYQVALVKTSALTGEPLAGATFGLFNEHGGLITTAVTDANGRLLFQTNTIEGIILREHVLYYVQELRPPPGYQLDSTKHWLCFCNETGDSCGVYKEIQAGVDVIRIPFEQSGNIALTNQLAHYDLPATGGPGIYPLILVSVVFIVTPLVYMSVRRRKRERRGVG